MTIVPVNHSYTTYFTRNGLKETGHAQMGSSTGWTPWTAYWEK